MTVIAWAGTRPSGHGAAAGGVGQFALLLVLAMAAGLGPAGWLAGAGYGLVAWALLDQALRRSGAVLLGPANAVTLARSTLIGGVTALVADWLVTGVAPVAVLVTVAAVALALDGLDGQVARRTGTTTPLGARFDMEADAWLIMVLSVYVSGSLGWWVLVLGLTRYAFVAAGRALPWLTAPLPPRFGRKTVAAVQGIALVVAAAGALPAWVAYPVVGGALAALAWSFTRDVAWLCRHRGSHPCARARASAARSAKGQLHGA